MKRAISLVLCVLMLATAVLPVAADSVAQTTLNAVDDYFGDNAVVEHTVDGMQTVTMPPVMGRSFGGASFDTVAQAPVSAAAHDDFGYTKKQKHTEIELEDRYYYSLLDAEHKAYYRQIDEAARSLDERVDFGAKSEIIDSGMLFFLYMLDTPELFYLGNTVGMLMYGHKTEYVLFFAVNANEFNSEGQELTNNQKSKIIAKNIVFRSKVNDFLATIPADAPDVVKERLIYAKLLRESYYNQSAIWPAGTVAEDNWTAYGIMVNGYGVCESYAEAFQLLCNEAGIRCTSYVGYTNEGPHKWNAVNIGDEWYQCDITYDDPIGGDKDAAYDEYFNITDEQMAAASGHDWWTKTDALGITNALREAFPSPVCSATKYGRGAFRALYEEGKDGTIHCFENLCDNTCENCRFTRPAVDHDFDDDRVCQLRLQQGASLFRRL